MPKSIRTYMYQQNGEINDSICYFNLENLVERHTYDTLGNLLMKESIKKSRIDSTILKYNEETGRTIEMNFSRPKDSKITFEHFYDNDFNIYYKWGPQNKLVRKARYNTTRKVIESHSYINNRINKSENKYDESGKLKENKLIIDGEDYNKSIYLYDGDNRLTQKHVYDKNDTLAVIVKYENLTKNNEVTNFYDSSNELKNSLIRYRYFDKNNNLIKVITYNPQANYSGIVEYEIKYRETD